MDGLRTPKKQRHERPAPAEPPSSTPQAPTHESPPAATLLDLQAQAPQPGRPGSQLPVEAAGSNEATLIGAAGPAAEPAVTDAAKAFRELRVRPALVGAERAARLERSPVRPSAASERPSSPKKRKATYNIDKEFILKDDKVKRNTDTQGDISQARGQLGQLLFEFSQIELNRDLLDAIKRTESKTGRTSSGRPPAPGRLDRAAFEAAVADAADLLQLQLSTVEGYSEDAALRKAILRTYAVQAIAAFADEDWSSDEEEEQGAGCSNGGGGGGGASSPSDNENSDSNCRRQRIGSNNFEAHPAGSGDAGSQRFRDGILLARPGSAAGRHSPPPATRADVNGGGMGRQQQVEQRPPQQQQQQQQEQQELSASERQLDSGGGGSMLVSPQRFAPVAAGSAAGREQEEGSSSLLPDAPPDAALEDTASAPQSQQRQQRQRRQGPLGEEEEEEEEGDVVAAAADDGGHMQRRMRMLSLEAEGSAQQATSSADPSVDGEGEQDGGPEDMLGSPVPVTSRRRRPAPTEPRVLPPASEQQLGNKAAVPGEAGATATATATAAAAATAAGLQQAGEPAVAQAGGSGWAAAHATPHEPARRLVMAGRALHQHHRQQQQQQQQVQQGVGQAVPESSDGNSGGQASSAAAEPPKRQRCSSDLPPLHQLPASKQQRQRQQQEGLHHAEAGPGPSRRRVSDQLHSAAEAAAATAAHRAAILGSILPRTPAEGAQPAASAPQQLQQQHEPGSAPAHSPGEGQPASNHQSAEGGQEAQQQQPQPVPAEGQGQQGAVDAPERLASDVALGLGMPRAANSGSSVWGSTLVCADLTVNDVASKYWPFLRSAMQGQAAQLQQGDKELVASLVRMLGDAVTEAYRAAAGTARHPAAEVKSLVAATAFDDFFRAKGAAESSGASL